MRWPYLSVPDRVMLSGRSGLSVCPSIGDRPRSVQAGASALAVAGRMSPALRPPGRVRGVAALSIGSRRPDDRPGVGGRGFQRHASCAEMGGKKKQTATMWKCQVLPELSGGVLGGGGPLPPKSQTPALLPHTSPSPAQRPLGVRTEGFASGGPPAWVPCYVLDAAVGAEDSAGNGVAGRMPSRHPSPTPAPSGGRAGRSGSPEEPGLNTAVLL